MLFDKGCKQLEMSSLSRKSKIIGLTSCVVVSACERKSEETGICSNCAGGGSIQRRRRSKIVLETCFQWRITEVFNGRKFSGSSKFLCLVLSRLSRMLCTILVDA